MSPAGQPSSFGRLYRSIEIGGIGGAPGDAAAGGRNTADLIGNQGHRQPLPAVGADRVDDGRRRLRAEAMGPARSGGELRPQPGGELVRQRWSQARRTPDAAAKVATEWPAARGSIMSLRPPNVVPAPLSPFLRLARRAPPRETPAAFATGMGCPTNCLVNPRPANRTAPPRSARSPPTVNTDSPSGPPRPMAITRPSRRCQSVSTTSAASPDARPSSSRR